MIYTPYREPVKFKTARQRTVYIERGDGEIIWHYEMPKLAKYVKKPRRIETVDVWHVTAENAETGKSMYDGEEVIINSFRADGGLSEIIDECERIAGKPSQG